MTRRAGISLRAIILSILVLVFSDRASSGARWGSYNPWTGECAGFPMEPCSGYEGGGSGAGGVNVVQCDSLAERALAEENFKRAGELFEEALSDSVEEGDKARQASCLKFLGLSAERKALAATSEVDKRNILSEAAKWYVELVRIEPENLAALQALLAIYEERGDTSFAQQIRSRIIDLQSADGRTDGGRNISSCTPQHDDAVSLVKGILVPHVSLYSSVAYSTGASDCRSFSLDPAPTWTFSGAFTASGNLFLVDTQKNRILSYKLPSLSLSKEISAFESLCCSTLVSPSTLMSAGNGYIVQHRSNLLSLQNDEGTTVWQFDVQAGARNSSGRVTSLTNWTLAGSFLIGFGDVIFSNGVYKSALFQVPLAAPDSFSVLEEIEIADPRREFYWGGFNFLTSINRKAYYLSMESLPAIYRVDPEGSGLDKKAVYTLPESYKRPGLLRATDGLSEFFGSVERAAMPTALFSSGEFLFLLMRRPADESTDWEVFKIDPASGALLSRRPLPIHPKHIAVISGATYWGFLEKGNVGEAEDRRLRQTVGSLLLIPRERIEGDGPLCAAEPFSIAKGRVYERDLQRANETTQLQASPSVIQE